MSNDYIHEHGDRADDLIVIPDDPGSIQDIDIEISTLEGGLLL